MDVTLHFGAHRTATTTFQRMMGQSGPALRARGLAYWGPKRTRSALFDGLLGPAAGILPWTSRRGNRAAGRVALALDKLQADGVRRLLVSEENMVGTLRQTLSVAKLYPDTFGRASRLAGAFGGRCTRIGLSIRSYDDWWASAIAFSVAKAGPAPSEALNRALVSQPRRWRHVIGELADAFPDAEVCIWTHEAKAARPEQVARTLLGEALPLLKGTRDWHNAAPTPAALRGHLRDLGESDSGVIDCAGRFMPFAAAEQRILQAQYAEDIAWLRSGQDDRIRFIDDPGEDPVATGKGSYDDRRAVEDRQVG